MGIDRKRVRELKASQSGEERPKVEPEPGATPPQDGKPSALVKHMRQVRNLVRRLRAGEDVEETWRKLNRNLRFINRAAELAMKEDGPNWWKSKNAEAAAIADALVEELESDRETATRLGHPEDAELYYVSWGPNVVERDGRFYAFAGTEMVGEFESRAAASAAADERFESRTADIGEDVCIRSPGRQRRLPCESSDPHILTWRNQSSRWSKLMESLAAWA
jgi:hypothetical protein